MRMSPWQYFLFAKAIALSTFPQFISNHMGNGSVLLCTSPHYHPNSVEYPSDSQLPSHTDNATIRTIYRKEIQYIELTSINIVQQHFMRCPIPLVPASTPIRIQTTPILYLFTTPTTRYFTSAGEDNYASIV